jgi:fused signal recognition particle receptor
MNPFINAIKEGISSASISFRAEPELALELILTLICLNLLSLLVMFRNSRLAAELIGRLKAQLSSMEGESDRRGRSSGEATNVLTTETQLKPLPQPLARWIRPTPQDGDVTEVVNLKQREHANSREEASDAHLAITEDVAKDEIKPQAESSESAIFNGLTKSRLGFIGRLTKFFLGRASIDSATLDDLEEVLILSDVGAKTAGDLVAEVKGAAKEREGVLSPEQVTDLLKAGIKRRLVSVAHDSEVYKPSKQPLIVLVVGVNGVGKTTTVAKLAAKYSAQGKKVLAVAADTFRAAAVEQLAEWSNRVGFSLVRGAENAKPSGVVFDGMVAAKDGGFDVVLIDTAGRLHTKSNLMQELEGVRNSIKKHFPDGPHETVLVLDGVSGQNALSQAIEFNQAVNLSGVVVTKLDGTPKGGIIVAISQELSLPVLFIGVGEKVDDLVIFNPEAFVDALFEERRSSASNYSPLAALQVC